MQDLLKYPLVFFIVNISMLAVHQFNPNGPWLAHRPFINSAWLLQAYLTNPAPKALTPQPVGN